jgi:hypothetical protein
MSANVTAGVDSFMTVITAGWDGVGVYVDMNKDGNFTVDERLFTQYKALTPPITYGNIPINIPLYVRTGAYRLRVLVGNGFGWPSGGCGNTAYGNYHDYTLNVTNNNPSMNNAGVSALNGPTNFCPDSQMVSVVVKNYGLNQINYVDVNWSIDGVLQTPVSSYATIDTIGSANGTTTVVNLGKVYFGSAAKVLSAWTSLPNFVTDTLTADDSLSNKSIVASMNGTYTIGGTNPDFATINAAINFLNIAGICGPVTFNIRPGTYAEKLVVKAIVGASDSNRVVFQSEGNNNNLVILTAATTSNTDGVVKFNGASYVTIKDISINQTNTTASAAVVINGTAVKDSLVNCIITTAATTTSGTYAISASSAGMNATVLKGNVVTGGYYGLYFYGSSTTSLNQNCVIEGNTISGAYYYTVYAYYCNNLKFLKNIVRSQGLASTHYLATFGYCDNGLVVSGNEFSSTSHTSTLYGLRIYYCDGAASNPGLISNNTLYFNTTGTLYGLYSYYSSYQNYYHNSVYGNSSGATNYPTYIYHTSATYANITFRNNIFSNYGTTGYAAYIYSPNFINSNFNLYYSNSAGSTKE